LTVSGDVTGEEDGLKTSRHRKFTVYDDDPGGLERIRCPECNWVILYGNVLDGTVQPKCNNCRKIIRIEFGLDVIR